MEDVYSGPGLQGVPRGTVKNLRLFTYHFAYQHLAGIDNRVGANGPWEVKRVLGTVPVEEDGSAFFRVPAKTPISVQPLDAEGKAVAAHAELDDRHARRKPLLHGLPCPGEPFGGGDSQCLGRAAAAVGNQTLVRPAAWFQLRPRSAAGAGQVLCRLPQWPAADGRQDACRFAARPGRLRRLLSGQY